jgi:lactate dehydrogenase-like 2-hydroxyacid dehydrogenase
MRVRKREGRLTTDEEGIVKALLSHGWRNQDIQALVNIGRIATINSARITEVKQNSAISPTGDDAVEFYKLQKQSFDPRTGLSIFHDERLIRAREAMIVAVQIFNSPILKFKTEVFAVLAHIAWSPGRILCTNTMTAAESKSLATMAGLCY